MWLTKESQFLFRKRGYFYFSRRVPSDLQTHYSCRRIVLSLRTKSERIASLRAVSMASKLDGDWLKLRWRTTEHGLERFIALPSAAVIQGTTPAPTMSEATSRYVEAKKAGRSEIFVRSTERAARYFVEACGNKPLDAYSRAEVNTARDQMFARGLTQVSVKRLFSAIQALVNFAARENGVENVKAFSSIYFGEVDASNQEKRAAIPPQAITTVQAECRHLDDQARWLIALISDTGLRLSEACGLHSDDVKLKAESPHLLIRTHPWRRLKTAASERIVPLVGEAVWAAKRAISEAEEGFLFPKYCSAAGCKSNSASAALNKWLGPRVPPGCVMHSFRHSFRDRLRAVECPKDVIDRLGGWTVSGIGETYGDGYPVTVLHRWMSRIVSPEDGIDGLNNP
jgi:integrase